jgi:hypothetical protein
MKKGFFIGLVAVGLMMFVGTGARADDDYDDALPQLGKQMVAAKLTLEQGITAATKQGKPISAQFEIDEDTHKFQLSVFVSNGDDLIEVIVDHVNGAIKASGNVIGDDIKDAKKQRAAMAKSSKSLVDVVAAVTKANDGYQVVQIVPALSAGKAVATLKLIKGTDGTDVKTVKQDL